MTDHRNIMQSQRADQLQGNLRVGSHGKRPFPGDAEAVTRTVIGGDAMVSREILEQWSPVLHRTGTAVDQEDVRTAAFLQDAEPQPADFDQSALPSRRNRGLRTVANPRRERYDHQNAETGYDPFKDLFYHLRAQSCLVFPLHK